MINPSNVYGSGVLNSLTMYEAKSFFYYSKFNNFDFEWFLTREVNLKW